MAHIDFWKCDICAKESVARPYAVTIEIDGTGDCGQDVRATFDLCGGCAKSARYHSRDLLSQVLEKTADAA